MPHGAPDWHTYRPTSPSHPVRDLAELAARLNSIVTFDRRGEVVALDDFEHGLLHCQPFPSGLGSAIELSPTNAKTGGYSVKLTAGSTANKSAAIAYYFHPTNALRIGAEFSFSKCPPTSLIELRLAWHDGTTLYRAWVRYNVPTLTFEYRDHLLVWQPLLTPIGLYDTTHCFHTCKLVADFSTHTFVRVLLNQFVFSIPTVPINAIASATYPHLFVAIVHLDTSDVNPYTFVDDLIVTQNEP